MAVELSTLIFGEMDGVLERWVISITEFHGPYWMAFIRRIGDFMLEWDLVDELWFLVLDEMW